MVPEHYATYQTVMTDETGCLQSVTAGPKGDSLFAPALQVQCGLCKKRHGFTLVKTYLIPTPNQKRRFLENEERLGHQMHELA